MFYCKLRDMDILKNAHTKTVFAVTLGCKLNYAETSSILERFVRMGWRIASRNEQPDIVIVHTCAVTGQAEQKSRQQIRRMIRTYPSSRIVVTGCYAQLSPDCIGNIEGVDVILGSKEKFAVDRYVAGSQSGLVKHVSDVATIDHPVPAHSLIESREKGRTRAFLKIQDGCDYGCAYCAIPLARGRSLSIDPAVVLEGAHALAGAGYREIVLTGVNIAAYHSGGLNVAGLLRLLDRVDVLRIRVSSIEPDCLTDELIDVVASSQRIMPHFHLPLQGGSDPMLRAMGRRYTIRHYRERLLEALRRIPECAAGADVMTGYPGESDEHFQSAYDCIASLPVAYLHIFPCSVRPGTALARQVRDGLRQPVPPETVRQRSRLLHELGERKKREYLASFVGREVDVLIEEQTTSRGQTASCSGYTRNYLRVQIAPVDQGFRASVVGEERRVKVLKISGDLDLEGIFVT